MVAINLTNIFAAVAITSTFITPVLANFHILGCEISGGLGGQTYSYGRVIALNSNTLNCGSISGAAVLSGWDGRGTAPSFLAGQAATCGVKLNFYKVGNTYQYYQNGGNGQKLGDCYVNTTPGNGLSCPVAFEQRVCKSKFVCYGLC